MSDEDLLVFEGTLDDPNDHTNIEVPTFVHSFVFARTGSFAHIEKSTLHAEGWAATAGDIRELSWRIDVLSRLVGVQTNHPWLSMVRARKLLDQHERTRDENLLYDAFTELENSISMIPQDHWDMGLEIGDHGMLYRAKYVVTKDVANLDRAIETMWESQSVPVRP
ncbi:hypothetical protein TWF694_009374 [Orbilia ellipsospora]|uniref:Uncharacterized protein n=1 Tax=Orbilia ellipsospora TaxID=2528407 RepID=A0AAV9XFP5_9PEZI